MDGTTITGPAPAAAESAVTAPAPQPAAISIHAPMRGRLSDEAVRFHLTSPSFFAKVSFQIS